MTSNEKYLNFLSNPFSKNLLDSTSEILMNGDKRKGFVLGQNNHHLLNEREKYIMRIQKRHSDLIATIEQINFIKIFLSRFPNKDFLSNNNINQLTYIQYHSEVLFHKVHTILEIMKLLINEVYILKIEPEDCSWNTLISKLNKNYLPMKIIDKYFKTFEKFIEMRHANSHRGIYDDVEKDKINLDFGFGVYEMHERMGIETDTEFKKIFPKYLINYKIKEFKKNRIKLVSKVQDIIYELTNDFLVSLIDEFEKKKKKHHNMRQHTSAES
ncbi:MAG: Cthe_2314 family HEPN domain-containing protein [Bacteroidales bacterium]|jgi:hypothetical protein